MRYFTYDLFLAQSDENLSQIEEERIQGRWDQSVVDYRISYKALADRMPREVYSYFSGWGFHDYQLLSFEVNHKSLRKMDLKLILSNDDGLSRITLLFKDVSFLEYHHENYFNEKSVMNRDMDLWLYEEFLSVDSCTLSFEVIFSSGASIAINFPNHAVTIIEER
ncbi:hypothetical protein LG307_13440 [Sutcliffiella horikoshii]|uniref:hypothetical protein n=1 Tax=Sutcliffiella horikoshii TaxID=79883 RepID=UPI00384C486E